jgi:hypothetical protein
LETGGEGSLELISLGWPPTVILLILASHIAGITGMSISQDFQGVPREVATAGPLNRVEQGRAGL